MTTVSRLWSEPELAAEVQARMATTPSLMPRNLARELEVSEAAIIKALPEAMRLPIAAEHAVAVWEHISQWEKVTFYAETPGIIIEIPCVLPKGKAGHGMYNIMGKNGAFGGHVLLDALDSIWLVSKPAFGLESHSVQFYAADGSLCFAVYLGRDAERAILPSVKEAYTALWKHYAPTQEGLLCA